jgi:hypothetical protein
MSEQIKGKLEILNNASDVAITLQGQTAPSWLHLASVTTDKELPRLPSSRPLTRQFIGPATETKRIAWDVGRALDGEVQIHL